MSIAGEVNAALRGLELGDFDSARREMALTLARELDSGPPEGVKSWAPAPLYKELRSILDALEVVANSGEDEDTWQERLGAEVGDPSTN